MICHDCGHEVDDRFDEEGELKSICSHCEWDREMFSYMGSYDDW